MANGIIQPKLGPKFQELPEDVTLLNAPEPKKFEPVPDPLYSPEGKASVAGQIESITAKGGPLMTQAQTRAKQAMNQRGLLNTSMAVGAGERAVYDYALPIASQDAGHHQAMNRAAQATQLQRGTMSHAENLGRETMRVADEIQRGQMRLSSELESDVLRLSEELRRGTMRDAADIEADLMNLNERLRRETMGVAEGIETRLLEAKTTQDIRRDWANLAQQLELQSSAHIQALERMGAENSQMLERMDAEQRYTLERTVIAGTQEIQKLIIAEIGAINRTPGLTAQQQQSAIDQVLARAEGHIRYLTDLVQAAPSWDESFIDFPDLSPVNESIATPAPAPAPAPAPRRVPFSERTGGDSSGRRG